MNINDFAYHILSSASIEEKLSASCDFSDNKSFTKQVRSKPNRSQKIKFKQSKKRQRFPSIDDLDKERNRAILFHFFANHELLALELMAETLLRFQDAGKAYRNALAGIMLDEQKHLRLYLREMQKAGLSFGDIPLSDFFWRAISGLKSVKQFTAYMSLSFEQANLDFSRYYMDVFSKIESKESASLLKEVYDDEIRHVKHGLDYFKKWKKPNESLWNAYLKELDFPMSARRAKGRIFYADVREMIGFDSDYIEHLNLFSHSKGRTPNLHYFNPLAEYEELESEAASSTISADLESSLLFLSKSDDLLFLRRKFSLPFLKKIKSAGFHIAESLLISEKETLETRKLNGFKPWANTAMAQKNIAPIKENFHQVNKTHPKEFFSKSFGTKQLELFLAAFPRAHYSKQNCIGKTIRTTDDTALLSPINELRKRSNNPLVLKADLASAGAHFYFINSDTKAEDLKRWMQKQKQDRFVLETWLERVVDFSIQFERFQDGHIKSHGFLRFLTTVQGRFKGTHIGLFNQGLDQETIRFLHFKETMESKGRLNDLVDDLISFFEKLNEFKRLVGPFAVDCMLYRDESNMLKLKPIVEINPRYTMGRVALEISKQVHPKASGEWRILSKQQLKKMGFVSFPDFVSKTEKERPLKIEDEKLFSGFLPTSDYLNAEGFISYLILSY